MVTRRRTRTKSQAIRDLLESNPTRRNRDVIEALSKRRNRVTNSLVGNIKAKLGILPNGAKARATARRILSAIEEARELAERLGGVQRASAIFTTLAELSA